MGYEDRRGDGEFIRMVKLEGYWLEPPGGLVCFIQYLATRHMRDSFSNSSFSYLEVPEDIAPMSLCLLEHTILINIDEMLILHYTTD